MTPEQQIERLRIKQRRAERVQNAFVLLIMLSFGGILVAAYHPDAAHWLIYAAGGAAILGVIGEVLAGSLADTYRWGAEDIELGKELEL